MRPKRQAEDQPVIEGPAPEGSVITVEAPSVEAALDAITAELGQQARIINAERVQRGGLGGFFTRELFQVTAEVVRPGSDESGDARQSAWPSPGAPDDEREAAPVDRLVEQAEHASQFGEVLRRELAERKLRLPSVAERDALVAQALMVGEAHPDFREVELGALGNDTATEIDLRHATDVNEPAMQINPGETPMADTVPAPAQDNVVEGQAAPSPANAAGPDLTGQTEEIPAVTHNGFEPAAWERADDEALFAQMVGEVGVDTASASPLAEAAQQLEAERDHEPEQSPVASVQATSDPVSEAGLAATEDDHCRAVHEFPSPNGGGAPTATGVAPHRTAEPALPSPPPSAWHAAVATPDVPSPVPAPDSAPRSHAPVLGPQPAGSVAWSLDALSRLGLPFAMVELAHRYHPVDDGSWIMAVQHAATPYCGTVDTSSAVLAGPLADELADGLGIPAVAFPDAPPYGGSVALKTGDDAAARAWLSRVQGDRWFHLVVGGDGWEGLTDRQPQMVSWVGNEAVVPALQVCEELGLQLGYFSDGRSGGQIVTPLEVALAVRSLLPRR